MRIFLFALALCVAGFSSYSVAQTEIACGVDGSQAQPINPAATHGIYLPAEDDLKILVVFARFRDDVSSHFDWPAGSNPSGYTTWIDPTMQAGSTNLENFTNYYNQMSLGAYRVTGTAVSVETPQNKSYYFHLQIHDTKPQRMCCKTPSTR